MESKKVLQGPSTLQRTFHRTGSVYARRATFQTGHMQIMQSKFESKAMARSHKPGLKFSSYRGTL
jgi:hypothetical protein